MSEKGVFYSEAAYALGVIFLGFGTALMEKADLGVSCVYRLGMQLCGRKWDQRDCGRERKDSSLAQYHSG